MKKLSVLLALGGMIALPCMQQAQAQVVTFTFEAPVLTGDWVGEMGSGSFRYDSSLVASTGPDVVAPLNLTLSLTILGQTFNETDDSLYSVYPQLSVMDAEPTFLSFWIEEAGGATINEPGAETIYLEGFLSPPTGQYDYTVQANVVGTKPVIPEPSAMAFSAVAALGLGAFIVRRRRAKAA